MLISQFCMQKISKLTKPYVKKLQEQRDVRTKLIEEYTKSIRLIKLYGFDNVKTPHKLSLSEFWYQRLVDQRIEELKHIRKVRYMNAFTSFLGQIFWFMLPTVIFTCFVLFSGKKLTGKIVFTSLAWISQMQWSLNTLPGLYNLWSNLEPTCQRL